MTMPHSHLTMKVTTWCYPSRWTNIWGSSHCIWTLHAQIWVTPGFQPSSLSLYLYPPFPPRILYPLSSRLPTDKLLIRCHGRGGLYLRPTLLIKHGVEKTLFLCRLWTDSWLNCTWAWLDLVNRRANERMETLHWRCVGTVTRSGIVGMAAC